MSYTYDRRRRPPQGSRNTQRQSPQQPLAPAWTP